MGKGTKDSKSDKECAPRPPRFNADPPVCLPHHFLPAPPMSFVGIIIARSRVYTETHGIHRGHRVHLLAGMMTNDEYRALQNVLKMTLTPLIPHRLERFPDCASLVQATLAEIQNRYTQKWLKQNNLEYNPLQHSSNKSAKKPYHQFEASRIKKFEKQFGKKPAGNRCHH
jgi:hypothetical protein